MRKYLNLNVFVSMGVVIIAILWLVQANKMGFTGIGDTRSVWGTAATVPKFLIISLIIVGIYTLIVELMKSSKSVPAKNEQDEANNERKDKFTVLIMMILILIYTLLLESVGFIICTIVLIAGSMFLFGSRNKILLLAIPVVFSVFLFAVFRYVLLINLPTFSLF